MFRKDGWSDAVPEFDEFFKGIPHVDNETDAMGELITLAFSLYSAVRSVHRLDTEEKRFPITQGERAILMFNMLSILSACEQTICELHTTNYQLEGKQEMSMWRDDLGFTHIQHSAEWDVTAPPPPDDSDDWMNPNFPYDNLN